MSILKARKIIVPGKESGSGKQKCDNGICFLASYAYGEGIEQALEFQKLLRKKITGCVYLPLIGC